MRHLRGTVGIALVPVMALLIPSVVLANAGTPLMWAGAIRLVCVNIVIGVGEGFVIWLFLRTRFWKTLGIMILANYASWLVGEVALLPLLAQAGKGFLGEQPLYHVWEFLRYVLAASFGLTVVFEWPFCFWILNLKPFRIVKSIVAVLVVNVASYAFLVHFYLDLSGTSLLTKVRQEPSLSFAANPKAWVYFIAPDNRRISRIRLNGTGNETVSVLSNTTDDGSSAPIEDPPDAPFVNSGLCLLPSSQTNYWDLYHWVEDPESETLLLTAFAKQETPLRNIPSNRYGDDQHIPDPFELPQLCEYLVTSSWEVRVGFWPIEGLIATKGKTKKQLALELPFLKWYSRSPSVLPGDQVVYQLGDQIVLLDLNQDLIGVITRGHSPVIVLEE
jgi:hypothetical protein